MGEIELAYQRHNVHADYHRFEGVDFHEVHACGEWIEEFTFAAEEAEEAEGVLHGLVDGIGAWFPYGERCGLDFGQLVALGAELLHHHVALGLGHLLERQHE